jgi:hypothetical protein
MNIELENMWKETVVVSIKAKSIVELEAVSETTSWYSVFARDSNPAAPEQKPGGLLIRSTYTDLK